MHHCSPTVIQKVYTPCFFPGFVFTSQMKGDADRFYVIEGWKKDGACVYEADQHWKRLSETVDKVVAGQLNFDDNRFVLSFSSRQISVGTNQAKLRIDSCLKRMNLCWSICAISNVLTLAWIGFLFWKKIQGVQLIFHAGGIVLSGIIALGGYIGYHKYCEIFADTVIDCFKRAQRVAAKPPPH
jgi:hypothetical protein